MAIVGFGTKLEVKQGAGSYTELVDILKLTPPGVKVKMAEYQPMRTTRYKRRYCGTNDVGDFSFSMVFVDATLSTLTGYLDDDTLTWRITHSDGTSTEVFAGKILEIARGISQDEIDTIDVTVAIDNSITFA